MKMVVQHLLLNLGFLTDHENKSFGHNLGLEQFLQDFRFQLGPSKQKWSFGQVSKCD